MDQSLDQLKAKYAPALQKISQLGVKLTHLHVQDKKLFIGAVAPSDDAKNQVWNAIKAVDHSYGDLTADITVDRSMPAPAPTGTAGHAAAGGTTERNYTVKAGDTLSAISKQFYGDAKHYLKIYNANRDVLSDPDLIKPGQSLKIPA